MTFLRQNWKVFAFIIYCIFVFIIDYYIGYSFYFSIIKIIFVSFVFLLYNNSKKFIENSDVYHYLTDLRYEYEKKHIIKPFLTSTQSSILFFFILFLVILKDDKPFGPFLLGLFVFLLILDSLNIFLRALTNKAELKSIRTPASLKQMRFVFATTTKITPLVAPAGKLLLGVFTFSEFVYPELSREPFAIGPFSKYYANNHLYKDLKVPIETSLDLGWEGVRQGQLKHPRPEGFPIFPERTMSVCSKTDCLAIGLSEMNFDTLTGVHSGPSPIKKIFQKK